MFLFLYFAVVANAAGIPLTFRSCDESLYAVNSSRLALEKKQIKLELDRGNYVLSSEVCCEHALDFYFMRNIVVKYKADRLSSTVTILSIPAVPNDVIVDHRSGALCIRNCYSTPTGQAPLLYHWNYRVYIDDVHGEIAYEFCPV